MNRTPWTGASLTLLLLAGCTPADGTGFSNGGEREVPSDCTDDGHDMIVGDVYQGSFTEWECASLEQLDTGPAVTGWSGVTDVLPGGFIDLELQVEGLDSLQGQQIVVANDNMGMHSRISLSTELEDDTIRLRWLLTTQALPGVWHVTIGLLQDFGEGGVALGPSVVVPISVMEVDEPERGLRAHLLWTVPNDGYLPDMDLQVFEPDGTRVSINDPQSESGAVVEHDGQTGCSNSPTFEAISWPQEGPIGSYNAYAFVWDACGYNGELSWTLAFSRYERLLSVQDGSVPADQGHVDGDLIDLNSVQID